MRGAARGVLRGDAFFAAIEPYRAIFAVALPPDFGTKIGVPCTGEETVRELLDEVLDGVGNGRRVLASYSREALR